MNTLIYQPQKVAAACRPPLLYSVADPETDQGGAKEQGEQKILLGRHSILVDIT